MVALAESEVLAALPALAASMGKHRAPRSVPKVAAKAVLAALVAQVVAVAVAAEALATASLYLEPPAMPAGKLQTSLLKQETVVSVAAVEPASV
jgi:hypothetical protein